MKKISDWFAGAKAGVCRNVGTKIVAMVAAVAMLGGVAGVSMTAMAEEGQTPDVQTTQQATPTTDTATTNDDASADGAATGSLLVDETFKNSTFSDPSKWSTKDGACLTASGCSNTMDTSDIQQKGDGTGYLQLTDGSTSKRGSVLYNQAIPSGNGLDITFDYYMYGGDKFDGNYGDGISFFLTDGAATLSQTGAGGAGMGYASVDEDGAGSGARVEGIAQGVLGIGLDEFGNFSKQSIYSPGSTERVTGGNDCTVPYDGGPHTVTLRGKGAQDDNGKWNNGYCVVAGAQQDSSFHTGTATTSENDSNGKTVRVLISEPNADDGFQTVTVYIDGTQVVSHTLDYKLPTTIKVGFSAGTGAASQAQLIRGLSAHSVKSLTAIDLVKAVSKDAYPDADTHIFKSGDTVPYVFTVTNGGTTTLNNVTVTDPNISNISCPNTPLAPGNPMTCTGELTLTDDMVKDGKFTNTATATGTDGDKTVSDIDSVTINTVKPLGAPDHHKKILSNGNGSYTLNLDVVGDSTESTTTTVQPLDIALVLDVSGSMADPMGDDSYSEVYALDTDSSYYVLVDGQYEKVSYNSKREQWRYQSGQEWVTVTPRTSADDTNQSHTQFYSPSSKIDALKTAVNNFISATAAENAKINDQTQGQGDLNRIALVKFAGNTSDSVGNDHYRDGRYTYNNTQIVSELTSDLSGLANTVTSLDAAGATRADYGFQKAQVALQSARPNAKKVVIFFTDGFTDGQPTSSDSFEDTVANDAIKNSKALKDAGATVYSIGVFADADPSNTSTDQKNRFNAYMHGVSSNYPNATAWNNLGQRADGSDYYKAASNADDLNKIFSEIQQEITTGTSYSNVSITDELSKYVQQSGIEYSDAADGNGFHTVTDGVTLTVKDTDGNPQTLASDQYTLLFNPAGNGTVKAQFASGYKLQKGWTYTLSYNVDLTQTAYDEYAANNGGYGNVTGDKDTDINIENPTSSEKPGFHSNDYAYVTYTADGKEKNDPYGHPVVQAADGSLQVRKDWDPVTPGADSVTVKVYKSVDGKETQVGDPLTLNAENSWTATVDHLAPGKYVVKEETVGNYESKVVWTDNDSELTTTDVWKDAARTISATITNTQETVTLDGSAFVNVEKIVKGKDWPTDTAFSFTLTGEDKAPMPQAEGKDQSTLTLSKDGDKNERIGSFNSIAFPYPGKGKTETYTYTVVENGANGAAQAGGVKGGFNYSKAKYQVTVTVSEQNGKAQAVVSKIEQIVDDNGKELKPAADVTESKIASFTNMYVSVSSLPLTGGTTARDWLVYGGGMGLAVLLAGAGYTIWRKRQLV